MVMLSGVMSFAGGAMAKPSFSMCGDCAGEGELL
jgi:hypothetical protein